ncbi:MAG: hypothetical protein ABSC48_16580 [Terracidiphilus sp.]|jgi:hypothetical protein
MVDRTEVFRTAYQLLADHGLNAHFYAARLSKEAEDEGKTAEAEFWKAVAYAVKQRKSN